MSIKVYVDTNVYLNSLQERDNQISKKVLTFLEERDIKIFVNDLSIINIHYITRKSINRELIKTELKKILSKHGLVPIDRFIIENSLDSEFKDFEDGVQFFCAKRVEADLIITNNPKDFKKSDIKIMTPLEFYSEYIED
jgi:predicted nucleic acid-binding protein